MKKNIYKVLAATFAMALVAASPATMITSHAIGANPNAGESTKGSGQIPADYWDKAIQSESTHTPAPTPAPNPTPAPTPNVGNSGSSDSGSSNSGSSYGGGIGFNANAGESTTGSGKMPEDYWGTSTKISNDVTVSVTGGQRFRSVMNTEHTVYQVYHCGISRASFKVTDADGNVMSFSNVVLEKGEDDLWYENIIFAEGVDTEAFTVTVTKGDASYLAENLGVSGIKVNGTVALLTAPETETDAE